MKVFGKAVFAAMLLMGTAGLTAAPAKADFAIGFSFGYDGGYFSDPCDYYDYYDTAPPWGLPPDYCEYPVYFEPVYFGGSWYRGPIYYRWYGGDRLYWLNGGWRRDEWRGARPSIRWTDRGGWHARRDWNDHGWGDFRHDDRGRWGSWDRGGWNRSDWNRGDWNHGDRSAWNRGDWNRGGDWNRDRGNWNRGADRGDWNRGGNRGAQPNDGQGGWGGRGQFGGGQPGGSWGGRGGGQSGGGWGGHGGGPGGGGPGGGGQGGGHHGH